MLKNNHAFHAAIFKLLLVPSVLNKNEYTVRKDARAGYSRRLTKDKDLASFSKGTMILVRVRVIPLDEVTKTLRIFMKIFILLISCHINP